MRYSTYQTEGYIASNSFEEWAMKFSSSMFLLMVEKVTLSFGYIFRNKTQYGTVIIGKKKIKFTPMSEINDVKIEVTIKTTVSLKWSEIPGTNHITRLCFLFFTDFSASVL